MTARRLLLQSIRYYWRTHLGVVLGSALAALVLTGALMVGDSVKATLRAQAEARVGKIGEALLCGERFVPWAREGEKRPQVVARMFYAGPNAAGVLMLTGTASASGGNARANKVQIVGVDDAFWKLSPSGGVVDFSTSEDLSGAGRAGLQPAVPGFQPGTSNVAESPQRDTPATVHGERSAANARPSTSEGPGYKPGPAGKIPALPRGTSITLNERLAAQLGAKVGDELLLRVEKPSTISKDAPLSGEEDAAVTLRARVACVVGDADFGRFALASGQVPPHTAFVPLAALQEKLGVGEKVNVMLNEMPLSPVRTFGGLTLWQRFQNAMGWKNWRSQGTSIPDDLRLIDALIDDLQSGRHLGDFDLRVAELSLKAGFEIRSPRVFLEGGTVTAARENERAKARPHLAEDAELVGPPPRGLDSLTYFVNELRAGDDSDPKSSATPYSMVTAIDAPGSGFVQAELADDEIQISRWLADDLGIGPGDKLTIKYFVMGERRQLVEKARTFTVLAPILEMDEPQLNGSWMPDFPGLADKANCRDWKPGFDFDSKRMRDKDQDYWMKYRGTPKAFVNLRVGQEMWGNRWGSLTSIRYPAGTKREQVERIAAFIDPAALGFRTVDLRKQALAATDAPVDFGQLFAAFSFFLIVAAAVLTGLLFTFSIEQRASEAGLLLAVGWTQKRVKKFFLREGMLLALMGSTLGVALAALYTKAVLHGLGTIWRDAVGTAEFIFAPSAVTACIGIASGVLIALAAMWLASRRLFKLQAVALMSGESSGTGVPPVGVGQASPPAPSGTPTTSRRDARPTATDGTSVPFRNPPLVSALVCLAAAIACAASSRGNPAMFFGAGALLLIGGLLLTLHVLRQLAGGKSLDTSNDLALRNTTRRRGRSLATVAVLASGVFMVVAVDSFRHGPNQDTMRRESGTGGFTLVGESASPIYEDLNSAKGREQYALDDEIMRDVRVVQMRVRDGDDASCLNLHRAMQPRVLGVPQQELATRGAFHFSGKAAGWPALGAAGKDASPNDAAINGVVDANTLQWAMQKKIGDALEYADDHGKPFGIRVVGSLVGSMLQGTVLISEQNFIAKFPNQAGYRFFLIDCPPEKLASVRDHLGSQLSDRGLELTPAARRLAEFQAVENTYLSIFQVLGGLGLLLGSAGLGIVVARNVLERRREFGLLEAVGFTPRQMRGLVFAEHRWLIIGALLIGTVSALVAVWPNLSARSSAFPWRESLLLLGGMAFLGSFWTWLATRLALRESHLVALRNE